MTPKIRLIYDSGAYSAYTQKDPIDIVKYGDFLVANRQHLYTGVNLDIIGPNDPAIAAELGYRNFMYLKERGVTTMPVFHSAEPVSYLDKYLHECDYIGLSSSMTSGAEGVQWYNLIYDYACDTQGFPVSRFHAFGDTSPQAMATYPWWSADSSTWVIAAGMAGRIFLEGSPVQFRSRAAKDFNQLLSTDTGIKRATWERGFVRANLDPTLCMDTEMRESDVMLIRTYMNAVHFLEVEESTREVDRYRGATSFFLQKKYGPGMQMNFPVQMYFVVTCSTSSRALAILTLLGVRNILISHYYNEPKQWEQRLLPYLYDPVGVTLNDPRIRKEFDFMQQFLLKPKTETELRVQYEAPLLDHPNQDPSSPAPIWVTPPPPKVRKVPPPKPKKVEVIFGSALTPADLQLTVSESTIKDV